MKLLIDWSGVCHIAWHRMESPDYKARTDIEQAEFARNLTSLILHFMKRFKPEETLFALDGNKYWRYKVYDDYYVKNARVYLDQVPTGNANNALQDVYYLLHDDKYYSLTYHEGMGEYLRTKLVKAQQAQVNALISQKLVKKISRKDMPLELVGMLPTYKGNRKTAKWEYKTPRDEFKKFCDSISRNLANTLCHEGYPTRVIQVPEAEADDIAWYYHNRNSAHDLVFITSDSDWQQLLAKGLFLKIYDPRTTSWVETTVDQARHKLAVKIIGGDYNDGIPGLPDHDKQILLGEKKAKGLVAQVGIDNIYKYLQENFQEAPLKRNLQLIYLENCPKKVRLAISKCLDTPIKSVKVYHEFSKYGLTAKDLLLIDGEAKEARESDIEEGMYEN